MDGANLRFRYWNADGSRFSLSFRGVQAERCAFRHAPAFKQAATCYFFPADMQILRTRCATGKRIFKMTEIHMPNQGIIEQAHIYRCGSAGENCDVMVVEGLQDLIRVVFRNNDEGTSGIDRNHYSISKTPDMEHGCD